MAPGLGFTEQPWASYFISSSLRSPLSRLRGALLTARWGWETATALNVSSSWLSVGLERAPSGAEAWWGGRWWCEDIRPGLSIACSQLIAFALQNLRVRSTGGRSSSRAQPPSSKGLWPRSSCLWMETGPCADPTGNSGVPSRLPRRADVKGPAWSLSQPCSPAPNLEDHITREA